MKHKLSLHSLQTRLSETWQENTQHSWTNGIHKQSVSKPVWLGSRNLNGDAQADPNNHGGADKAVCRYPDEHYADWRGELELHDLPYNSFSENFTTHRLLEEDVCIEGTFKIDTSIIQVTRPRRPCNKLNRRWNLPNLNSRLDATRRCGWFLQVIVEDWVESGQDFALVEPPSPQWSIDQEYTVRQDVSEYTREATALLSLEWLAENWRASLRKKWGE